MAKRAPRKSAAATGGDVLSALKDELKAPTLNALAKHFGVTIQALQNWKKRDAFTASQIAGLVRHAIDTAKATANQSAVKPLVEFWPIVKHASARGAKKVLFSDQDEDGDDHPYFAGLKAALKNANGVYVFFDSRGQAIYVGKARRQKLWDEMTNAFNRQRGDLQTIRRVKHPSRRQAYKSNEEKSRQIVESGVPLHELASYFSAYEVADGVNEDLEALLVRSFSNDLLNKRMENFGAMRMIRKKVVRKKARRRLPRS
jgi:hypothetical protein